MQPTTNYHVLAVNIKNPEEILFDGQADAISSTNEKGNFDVLPLHANFISIIKDLIVIYQGGQKLKELKIDKGILKVNSNKITIFLGVETFEEQPIASPLNPAKK